MNLALEVFEAIEAEVGCEPALRVAKSVDAVVARLKESTREQSLARRAEIKGELKQEFREELATKVDIANLRTELGSSIANLKLRTTVQFLVTIFVIVIMNPQAQQLIGRILGLAK